MESLNLNLNIYLLPILLLVISSIFNPTRAACTLLKQLRRSPEEAGLGDNNIVDFNLQNFCKGWMFNVEVNNIRGFENVPEECSDEVGNYMTRSLQYSSDIHGTAEECVFYLANSLDLSGKDAWIFDIDETLVSTLPYYKIHGYGTEKTNVDSLEKWIRRGEAPALDHALCLYNHVKSLGLKIFLISSRKEYLRSVTVDNLIAAGYHGWSGLFLRTPFDVNTTSIEEFKKTAREEIVTKGYRIWAVVSSQWSSLLGEPEPMRIFKFPNPMYYEL